MLNEYLEAIIPADKKSMEEAEEYWDKRTHPIGSLGKLEEMTIRLAGIQGRKIPSLSKKSIIVMCSDNGVVAEDISSSPQEFTQMLANAMARGETGVAALSRHVGADLCIVDMGMLKTMEREKGIIDCVIREGSGNISVENAMTREEAIRAIDMGIAIAEKEIKNGSSILGTGELGIGNTTTSSALLAAMTTAPIEDCVGYGAGISDVQHDKKLRVVERALKRLSPESDTIDILASLGGFDIAGIVGVFIAGAYYRVPVVVDGLISGVAALVAIELNEHVRDYLFVSHKSAEKASNVLFRALKMEPSLDLAMRLGEGSGCPLFFQLLETAIACMTGMGSIADNAIDPNRLVSLRGKK